MSYETLEIQVIYFTSSDVVRTSGVDVEWDSAWDE